MSFKSYAKKVAPLQRGERLYVSPVFDITKDLKPGMRIKYREDRGGWREGTFTKYWAEQLGVWADWEDPNSHGWMRLADISLA